MSKTLKLKTRHYRALPIDKAGYAEDVFELPVETHGAHWFALLECGAAGWP